MNQVSVLQQMYVNQGQFIIGEQSEKMRYQKLGYRTHLILPMLIGVLLGGIALAVVVTLYIKSQCKCG